MVAAKHAKLLPEPLSVSSVVADVVSANASATATITTITYLPSPLLMTVTPVVVDARAAADAAVSDSVITEVALARR
jgi:hypothetical protein